MEASWETDQDALEGEAQEEGVAKVTSNGFVRKVLVSFPKQVPMFESEVDAEFTWPPRPVVQGESFRVSRASSGIRKGAAYTPMPKHWPEENSMHSKQESAELYGTVLKARDKRLTQLLNRQKQKLLKMLSYRPGITLKSVNDVKMERENRLKSIKTYKSPLKVEKIKRTKVKRVPRNVYKITSYPSNSKKQPPKKHKIKQKLNQVGNVITKQSYGQYDISMSPPTVKTGDYLIDLGNTKPPDLEWELAKPGNKYQAKTKRKRPSSAPATKLDHVKSNDLLEDWSKELGSPGFKTIASSKLENATVRRRNLPTRNIIKGPPQRTNNNSDAETTDIRDLQKNSIYGNASELSITSPSRRNIEIKDKTSQVKTDKEVIGAVDLANEKAHLHTAEARRSKKDNGAIKHSEHNGIQEGSSILLPWDQTEAKLVQEGIQINQQRSKPKGQQRNDAKSSINPIFKLDTDRKPVRMPMGSFNDMMIGPTKDAMDDYQNEILRLKLEYMLKAKKKEISVSEEKLIENEVYVRQQQKDLKVQTTNKKKEASKSIRSRDSIFHPSDKLRKSRSTGRLGNKYIVPIPAIQQDESPVVGFGYHNSKSKIVSRMNNQNPMELVRSLSRQSQKSRKSRQRIAPPEGWDMHVHIDGTDFFVNKVTKESVRNIPKSVNSK